MEQLSDDQLIALNRLNQAAGMSGECKMWETPALTYLLAFAIGYSRNVTLQQSEAAGKLRQKAIAELSGSLGRQAGPDDVLNPIRRFGEVEEAVARVIACDIDLLSRTSGDLSPAPSDLP